MSQLVSNIKRLFSVYFCYQLPSIKKFSAYRAASLLQFVNLFMWVLIDLIFFRGIFSNAGGFAGWEYWDVVLLIFSQSLFWDIFWRVTSGGIVYLPDKIFNGEINKFLLKPVNSLFHLAVSEAGVVESSLNTPILLGLYILNRGLPFSIEQILMFLILIILGVGIFTWILVLIVSLCFWATNVDYLSQIYWEIQNIARFPKDVFSGFLANLFMFILPVFFIANIPTDALRHGLSFHTLLLALVLNIVLATIGLALWKSGLKRYAGVSV